MIHHKTVRTDHPPSIQIGERRAGLTRVSIHGSSGDPSRASKRMDEPGAAPAQIGQNVMKAQSGNAFEHQVMSGGQQVQVGADGSYSAGGMRVQIRAPFVPAQGAPNALGTRVQIHDGGPEEGAATSPETPESKTAPKTREEINAIRETMGLPPLPTQEEELATLAAIASESRAGVADASERARLQRVLLEEGRENPLGLAEMVTNSEIPFDGGLLPGKR